MRLIEALLKLNESRTGYKGFDDYSAFWTGVVGLKITDESVEYPSGYDLSDKGYCKKLITTFLDWMGNKKPDNTYKSSVRIDYLLKNRKEDLKHFGKPKPNKSVFIWNGIHNGIPTMVNLMVYPLSRKTGMRMIPSISVNMMDSVTEYVPIECVYNGVLKKQLNCNFSAETINILKDIHSKKSDISQIVKSYPSVEKQLSKYTVKDFEKDWVGRKFELNIGDGTLCHSNVTKGNLEFKLSKSVGPFNAGYIFDVGVSEIRFLNLESYFKISRNNNNSAMFV